MSKTRLKVGFFQSQIEYLLELQQQLEQIRAKLKEAIVQVNTNSNLNVQMRTLSQACYRYQYLAKEIREESKNIKLKSDLFFDEGRYQGEVIFRSLEDKVEDLNQRLYQAEKGVQKAENLKKAMDPQKNQYKMSNTIGFKTAEKTATINNYLEAQQKIKNQFKRGINLMLKISQKAKKTDPSTQFQKQLKMRAANMKFQDMKKSLNPTIDRRKCKSQQKNPPLDSENQPFLSRKEPLISLFLKSPSIKYKKYRQVSLQDLVTKLRQNNKKSTMINKLFKKGLELKNRNQVLKFLESKQVLTQEESIMKIQLMSDQLNYFVEEKMLSLKQGKKSKEFQEKVDQGSRNSIMVKKKSKSLEKFQMKQQRHFKLRKSNTKVNLKKQLLQQFGSYASNQKTTDSLN